MTMPTIEFKPGLDDNRAITINRAIDQIGSGKVILCVEGHPNPEEAFQRYAGLMDEFELPLMFYPYSEAIGRVNTVFGRNNPLAIINFMGAEVCDLVRFINFGWSVIDIDRLAGVRFDQTVKEAIFDRMIEDLYLAGMIPSNGVFIDVHESWKLFEPYRGAQIEATDRYRAELDAIGIKLDNTFDKTINFIMKKSGMNQ